MELLLINFLKSVLQKKNLFYTCNLQIMHIS